MFLQIATLLAVIAMATAGHHAPGYSYAKFSGPVSGPEKEIYVSNNDHHGHGGHGHAVDYVAKPDYHFAYGVEDPKSKVSQSRKETRHGDTVHGEYSVVDPNGILRTVKYTADKHNGFQAKIFVDGKEQHDEAPAAAAVGPAHIEDHGGHHKHEVTHEDEIEGSDEYY